MLPLGLRLGVRALDAKIVPRLGEQDRREMPSPGGSAPPASGLATAAWGQHVPLSWFIIHLLLSYKAAPEGRPAPGLRGPP